MGVIDNDNWGWDVDYVASRAGSFHAGQVKRYAAVADCSDLPGGLNANQGNGSPTAFGADLARGLDAGQGYCGAGCNAPCGPGGGITGQGGVFGRGLRTNGPSGLYARQGNGTRAYSYAAG